jgi:predicted nucleic acid-binding protein
VDLLRRHPPAVAWARALGEPIGIAGFAALELVSGCRNKTELRFVRRLLAAFTVLWPTEADMDRALNHLAPLRMSRGLGLLDSVIAATVAGRGDTLLTFNVAHYSAVPGLALERPYMR